MVDKPLLHGQSNEVIPAATAQEGFGFFGRMFEGLRPFVPPGNNDTERDNALLMLAQWMVASAQSKQDNTKIPAGYTYFGQFVDHDITFDPVSSLDRQNDPKSLQNFRTPRFDLDSLYGRGHVATPFLYDQKNPGKFLLGTGENAKEADLPRNSDETALIGDPRNDENVILSQIQVGFLKFHNAVMDSLLQANKLPAKDGRKVFNEAQKIVRWTYQWVVINDFLKRIVDKNIVDCLLPAPGTKEIRNKFYKPGKNTFIPVEFSVAAYRLGHTMVRDGYSLNSIVGAPLFVPNKVNNFDDLRGGHKLVNSWTIEWDRFLNFDNQLRGVKVLQFSHKLEPKIAFSLKNLPGFENKLAVLPYRNLARGWRMCLPSGQAIARSMGIQAIKPFDSWTTDEVKKTLQQQLGDKFKNPSALDEDWTILGQLQMFALNVSEAEMTPSHDSDNKLLERFFFSYPRAFASLRQALGGTINAQIVRQVVKALRCLPPAGWNQEPLWHYVLREAAETENGERLGAIGGRIVAEVFIGLLAGDPNSYLNCDLNWKPQWLFNALLENDARKISKPNKMVSPWKRNELTRVEDIKLVDIFSFAGVPITEADFQALLSESSDALPSKPNVPDSATQASMANVQNRS